MDKQKLRSIMKEKRQALSPKTFSLYNQNILSKVLSHPLIQEAKIIGCYVSLPGEVDTFNMIEKLLTEKRICVPKVIGNEMEFYEIHSFNDLQEGCFHVLEPFNCVKICPQEIDCMLVPLLAYDQDNYRVGYGKGYYDRYLANYSGLKVALCFAKTIYNEIIPSDEYDIKMDLIIDENILHIISKF